MNEPGEIVGMVDVLKLTYATLEQVGFPDYFLTLFLTVIDQYHVQRGCGGAGMGQVLAFTGKRFGVNDVWGWQ